MAKTEKISYSNLIVNANCETTNPQLCFEDGSLFVYVYHGINTIPERKDVTEKVANAIAKYIKEN